MYELINYEQARKALALCANVDEVKDIHDKSEAMRLYAKMSENTELEVYSATIKLRAQVRLGEIIAGMEKNQGPIRSPDGTNTKTENIKAAGISKTTAHHYEKLAAVPEEVIEDQIAKATAAQKPISMTKVLDVVKPPKPKPEPPPTIEPGEPKPETITILKEQFDEMNDMIQESLAEEKALADMLDAEPDERLAEATIQIKNMVGQLRLTRFSLEAANNRNNELLSIIKSKDRQIRKMEKEIEKYKIKDIDL